MEGWNRWKAENFDAKANLSGANLSRANLAEANLIRANLVGTDLIGADLIGADLRGAYLNEADLRGAYLNEADLSRANLSKANLIGVNLSKADLSKADLWGANLWGANLSGANLTRADLTRADLTRANLSGANLIDVVLTASALLASNLIAANLTGACIWDWNISNETQLDDVICEYVYLKGEWLEKKFLLRDRRPSNPNHIFAPGEFQAFVQKALSTVDLIFADGIDWQAFFQSFQELRSQYEDLSIQAIEKKSGVAFVVRLEVPAEGDKAAIGSCAKELYETKLQLQEQRYRAELQAKDGRISLYQEQLEFHRQNNTNLMEIVKTMAEKENQPTYQTTIHAQTIGATHSGSGDITGFTMNVNSNIDDITKLITSLRDAAQSLPEAQREEALVHLDDLQEDLSQPEKQKPSRIKTRLVALFAIASTASGMVVGETDFGNKVLDLSKKLGIELVQPQFNQQLPPSK